MGLTWYERWLIRAVGLGPVPEHIAYIMDGNRRWAEAHNMDKKSGHSYGYSKLELVLESCFELGVKAVSVYAFSTENYKRGADEVDALMALAKDKLCAMMNEEEFVEQYQVCVRVLGELDTVEPELRRVMARVMQRTRHNTGPILNICFAYSSHHELATTVNTLVEGVARGVLVPEDVSPALVHATLHSSESPPVGLLVRTSGEVRLSDYYLLQSAHACLSFVPVMWPDLSVWNLVWTVLDFQVQHRRLCAHVAAHVARAEARQRDEDAAEAQRRGVREDKVRAQREERCRAFVREHRRMRFAWMDVTAGNAPPST